MLDLSNLHFYQLLNWFAWIPGVILFALSAFGLAVILRSPEPAGPTTISGFLFALAAGGLLFFPDAPRVARTLFWLAFPPSRPAPSGSLSVATASVLLPPALTGGAQIIAQIWYPAENPAEPSMTLQAAAPINCLELMAGAPLSRKESGFHVILYAPGNGAERTDGASTAAELAGHGYVALAIDDIDREAKPANEGDELSQPLDLNFPTAEFRILRSFHDNLCDRIFRRPNFVKWLVTDPYRIRSIQDAYVLAFFDTYLRQISSPLLSRSPSPFHGVEVLKGNEAWQSKAVQYAILSAARSR